MYGLYLETAENENITALIQVEQLDNNPEIPWAI